MFAGRYHLVSPFIPRASTAPRRRLGADMWVQVGAPPTPVHGRPCSRSRARPAHQRCSHVHELVSLPSTWALFARLVFNPPPEKSSASCLLGSTGILGGGLYPPGYKTRAALTFSQSTLCHSFLRLAAAPPWRESSGRPRRRTRNGARCRGCSLPGHCNGTKNVAERYHKRETVSPCEQSPTTAFAEPRHHRSQSRLLLTVVSTESCSGASPGHEEGVHGLTRKDRRAVRKEFFTDVYPLPYTSTTP
jgi:hypothetical protein